MRLRELDTCCRLASPTKGFVRIVFPCILIKLVKLLLYKSSLNVQFGKFEDDKYDS